jgi:serine/threonine protein kinase
VHVIAQVADALVEAHEKSLIHRDIKPANVLLTNCYAPDVVKVVDFGLVKDVTAPEASVSSAQGVIAGTPAYMSPESIAHPDGIGPWSDVYSVGCLAYFLLTGVEVFASQSAMETYSHQLRSEPVPPSVRASRQVPAPLEELVLRCLRKKADERPTTTELRDTLRTFAVEPWGRWDSAAMSTWWATTGATISRSTPIAEDSTDRLVPKVGASVVRANPTRRGATISSSAVTTLARDER